jgi:hypothetical protein
MNSQDNPKAPPVGDRLVSLAIPPGCSTMSEAHERAEQHWVRIESRHRLLGLLIAGKLIAWLVDADGDRQIVAPEFWSGNMYLSAIDFEFGSIRDYGYIEGKARVVFLTADLDEQLPWDWQVIERYKKAEESFRHELATKWAEAPDEQTNESAISPRPRGRKRIKGDEILKAMREMDRNELKKMSYKAMKHRFAAVGSTCESYRKQVLAINGDN